MARIKGGLNAKKKHNRAIKVSERIQRSTYLNSTELLNSLL